MLTIEIVNYIIIFVLYIMYFFKKKYLYIFIHDIGFL